MWTQCPHCPHKNSPKWGQCPAANPCVPMGLGDFCHFARKIGQKSPNRISRGDTRPTSWSVWSAQPTPPELPQRATGTSLQLCPFGVLTALRERAPGTSPPLGFAYGKTPVLVADSRPPNHPRRKGWAIVRFPGGAGRGRQSRRVRTCRKQREKHFESQKSRNNLRCNGLRLVRKFFKTFFEFIKPAGPFQALYTRRAERKAAQGRRERNKKAARGKTRAVEAKSEKGACQSGAERVKYFYP